MLSVFRNNPKLVVVIFALVAIAFIGTGVVTHEFSGLIGGQGAPGQAIATVGDHQITTDELDQRIQQQYRQMAQQQPGLDMAAFVAQAFNPIVDQYIGATAIEQFGRSIGLVASAKQVGGQIGAISAFHGPDGKFSQQTYQAILAQQRLTDAQVRADFASDIVRQMVYLPATGALTIPDGLVKPYAALLLAAREGSVGFVPASAMTGGAAPTDQQLQGYYKAHIAAYTTPEQRVLRYALIGRDQVARGATPSEAEIRAAYDAAPDKYAARETRDLQQVVLPDEAKARAFEAAVKGGKSFADAATAAGFTAADIAVGTKTQAQYAAQSSPAAAAAAFALPAGGVSDPIKAALGYVIVKADKVEKVAATPYDKARPGIAADLTKQKQDKALADLVAHVQDALDNGQGFADVAKADGLQTIDTPPLTASGAAPTQPGYKPSADVQPLLASAFKMSPDDPPSVETVQQGERYALVSIGKVVPATPIPLAQVKDRVQTDFLAQRAQDRAKAIASAIQAKVKAGTAMAAAFKAAPAKLPDVHPANGRRIDLARLQGNVPPELRAFFQARVGGTDLVAAPGGAGWFVVHVDKVTPADDKLVSAIAGQSRPGLAQDANNEFVQQLAEASKLAVGTHRDEGAIAALRARLLGATPAQ